jgi:hypothetical protein
MASEYFTMDFLFETTDAMILVLNKNGLEDQLLYK